MTETVETLIRHYGIVVAALLIFLTELGIPTGVPNEVVLVLAGSYAIHSDLEFAIGFVLVTAADVLGTTGLYLMTRTGGLRLLRRFSTARKTEKGSPLRRWLHNHDIAVIIVARSLPLVRMSVAISAGLLRIQRKHYLLGVIPGAIVWAGTPLTLGYLFRNDVHRLIDRDQTLTHFVLLVFPTILVLLGIFWLARRVRDRLRSRSLAQAETPEPPARLTALDERARALEREVAGGPSRET